MLKQKSSSFADSNSAFLLTGTLEDMNVRMIGQVLDQDKGNKEKNGEEAENQQEYFVGDSEK